MITTFTIDRAKWLNGSIPDDSALRDTKGRMCCLGFYAKACGVKAKPLTGKGYPHQLTIGLPNEMDWLIESANTDGRGGHGSNAAYNLVRANDDDMAGITRRERERSIKAQFRAAGITVKFTGRYPAKSAKRK
jgi:hypothetical protein